MVASVITEVELARLQRAAEARATVYWDADEAAEIVAPAVPIAGALGGAFNSLAEAIADGPNKTPFLGPAYLTEYLKSGHWKAIRTRALQRAGGYCSECRHRYESRELEVHHLTYRNVGQERESELVVLCHGCHEAAHGRTW